MALARAVIAKEWRHVSGKTASTGGAPPWGTLAPDPDWAMANCGWTIEHPDGTRGIGRAPFATREEAQAWIEAHPRFPGWNQG